MARARTQMSETLIELVHTYMGEFAYGMFKKRNGGSSSGGSSRNVKRSRAPLALSAKVQALQRKVALMRPENKQFYARTSITNVTDTGAAIGYILPLVQGNTESTRIGDKIRANMLKVRLRCASWATTSATAPETYAISLIMDKESGGSIPVVSGTSSSIFNSFSPETQQCVAPLARDRFKLLRQMYCSAQDFVQGGQSAVVDWVVPLNKVITYNGTAGTVADAGCNQMYIVVSTTDPADIFDVVVDSHLFYTDL